MFILRINFYIILSTETKKINSYHYIFYKFQGNIHTKSFQYIKLYKLNKNKIL